MAKKKEKNNYLNIMKASEATDEFMMVKYGTEWYDEDTSEVLPDFEKEYDKLYLTLLEAANNEDVEEIINNKIEDEINDK